MNNNKQGYLYVLANSSMPGLVKVGRTSRLPSERAEELAGATGVPTPFIVVLEQLFEDCDATELFVHTQLERKGYRVSTNREFFRAPVSEVVRIIMSAPGALGDTSAGRASEGATDSEEDDLISKDMPAELTELTLDNYRPPQPWESVFEEAEKYYYGFDDYIQDYDEAFRLYKDAAKLGSSVALARIGDMYLYGNGVSKNLQKALDFYKETVKKGNYYGYTGMGDLFYQQRHIENRRKCYKAFFEARAKRQDPLVEEHPGRRKFAWACYSYINASVSLDEPVEFTDSMKAIAQDLTDVASEMVTAGRGEEDVSHYETILSWIKRRFDV